ncbi:MAG: DNA polymerase I [Desulfovibrionaceae bacterium]|nr:DNA polymerase I [Desulfovibrionaceae bacterium]MBF0512570.1 DNA polymerase I [Desulfovibrionaceae bacterium]
MPLKDKLGFTGEPLYLIDGSSFLYRGFYAYPDLRRSDGLPTNALYIVLRILLRLLREEKPRYAGFFLDGKGKNFRHGLYPEYKANREAMPEPLTLQVEPVGRGAGLLGFPLLVLEGAEADDGIASLAKRFGSGMPVVIVGSDKDLRQCISENVVLWDPGGKQDKLVTLRDFTEEYGIAPSAWPDLQALVGDTSDNIPGVAGIGPKSAVSLIRDWSDLEGLREHVAAVKPAWRDKIAPQMDAVFVYRELTRLKTDRLPDLSLEELRLRPGDKKDVLAFFNEFELRSLARDLANAPEDSVPAAAVSRAREPGSARPVARQLSLFSGPDPGPAAAERGVAPIVPGALPSRPQLLRAAAIGLAELSGLAGLDGASLGLVADGEDYELALHGREVRVKATPEQAAAVLARAGRVHTPSFKELLAREPAFAAVPLNVWFDLSLAGYLLNPEDRNYSFERLLSGYGEFLPENAQRPGALAALELGLALEKKIDQAALGELMRGLETPLIPVLVGMEQAGIGLDLASFEAFLREVSADLDRLTGEIFALAGTQFNIRSSRQLAEILYDRLGLKRQGKTPGGAVSTSVEVLERLEGAHPVVDKLLAFRKLEKLRSTYLEPLPKLVGAGGRIHTTFNQLAAATGRLSSSNPNLQNIPIRGDMGRRMRACFTAKPGHFLAAADYSQIELRVLAHFSGDETLIAAFERGLDIHAQTAALLCDKKPDAISADERRLAKTINFGLLYGMGPQKLSRELGIGMNRAKEFIAKYFERLTGLKQFYEAVIEAAGKAGYVTTLAGRRRFLPELHSQNSQLQSQAKRQAVNTVIQGSAADIIKMAMIAAAADTRLQTLGATLILQVHDELVLEAPEKNAAEAGRLLAEIMSKIYSLRVPLAVDTGIGRTWADAH